MLHRLPEQHECLFDHLGRGRQEAVLKMVKLDRKVGRSCQRIGEECSWAAGRISVFRRCLSTNRDLIFFFFSSSHFVFQDLCRFFGYKPPPFSFKLCSLFLNPTVTHIPVIFCLCRLDHIPAAKMPFGKSKPRNDRTIKSKGYIQFLFFFARLHKCEQSENE